MRKFLCFLLLTTPVLAPAAVVPVSPFDQAKLEGILRKMPGAYRRSEAHGDFVRKFYSFPASKSPVFYIKCNADHYVQSPVPSEKRCEVKLDEYQSNELRVQKSGDEWQVEIMDKELARELFKGLSFGPKEKKVYSTERVYGQAFDGEYRELFRYMIACTETRCRLTLSSKDKTE